MPPTATFRYGSATRYRLSCTRRRLFGKNLSTFTTTHVRRSGDWHRCLSCTSILLPGIICLTKMNGVLSHTYRMLELLGFCCWSGDQQLQREPRLHHLCPRGVFSMKPRTSATTNETRFRYRFLYFMGIASKTPVRDAPLRFFAMTLSLTSYVSSLIFRASASPLHPRSRRHIKRIKLFCQIPVVRHRRNHRRIICAVL